MKLVEIKREPEDLSWVVLRDEMDIRESKNVKFTNTVTLEDVSDKELDDLKKKCVNTVAYTLNKVHQYCSSDYNYTIPINTKEWSIPKRVIFNPPATVVFWWDGTKTVVKCQGDEEFDEEVGLAMAIAQHLAGNRSKYKKIVKNASRPQEKHALK